MQRPDRTGTWESFLQDLRFALRGMRRSPGFTLMAVASLALGIGANTAIFSILNTVLLRLLPVTRPEQLVELLQRYPGEPRGIGSWSAASYRYLRDHNTVFSALIGTSLDHRVAFRADGQETAMVVAEYVTGNYFPVLGVRPAIGRTIGPEDDPLEPPAAVAMLSWSCWTSRFQRDAGVLGRRMFVGDEPVTIIGVAPRDFAGLRLDTATDIWLPRTPQDRIGTLLGRLKSDSSMAQARAELPVLFRFVIEERAASSKDPLVRQLKIEAEPAGGGLNSVRDRFGKPLRVLMLVVGLLLAITCVNLAGLLLARGIYREREIGIRVGLGASRTRLMAQLMAESLLLTTFGLVAGVCCAYFATTALLAVITSGRLHEQVHLRVRPDLHVLAFTAGVALASACLIGLVPAWRQMEAAPAFSSQTIRTLGIRSRGRLGRALVTFQVAISVLLLGTGALFVTHLWQLEHRYLGFRRDHILLVRLEPARRAFSPTRLANSYREVLDRLNRLPGVISAAICAPTPLSGAGASGFATVEGSEEAPAERRWIAISWVGPRYFAMLGTPLLAGREFERQDATRHGAIVNRTMARHYFAGRDPIGRHVTLDHVTMDPTPKAYEIVGVVADANYTEIREVPRRAIYLPAFHDGAVSADHFALRTSISPESLANGVRSVVRDVLGPVPVSRVITLDAQIDASIVLERLMATLAGSFATLGALLVGIGLFGLLAYSVARRTSEIGMRMALGATTGRVYRMVIWDAMMVVAAGLALDAPLLAYARVLAQTAVQDLAVPNLFVAACAVAVMVLATALAAYLPARRAAHVDPVVALRQEEL